MSDQNLLDIFLSAGAHDAGNAECAYAAMGDKYLWNDAFGWLTWTGTHWDREFAEQNLESDIITLLKSRCKLAIDKEALAIAKASTPSANHMRACKSLFGFRVLASSNDFDSNPDLLNVRNGVLDLRNGNLSEHDSSQRFTYCINTPYDPSADDTVWTNFLWDTLSDHTDTAEARSATGRLVAYLQMVLGYVVTGHTNEECAWFIHGPARSGKGTFTEALVKLLGYPLAIETDFGTFTAKREAGDQGFDLAPLKPARAVFASESNTAEWLNTGKVKRLTGGNYITCAFKHRDQFTFRPQFKVILTSNHPVRADVDDDAMWYRVKLLEFPNGHSGTENKQLKASIKSDENLRGILRWIVDGAMAWYTSPNGLTTPDEVNVSTSKARDEIDFVQTWLAECTSAVSDVWTPNSTIYASYSAWCDENGVKRKSQRGFALTLQKKGYTTGVVQRLGLAIQRGVSGLQLL